MLKRYFVGAAMLNSFATRVSDEETIPLIFHVLNTSDIPKGSVAKDG